MLKNLKKYKLILFLFLSLIFSLPVVAGLLRSGFPLTDDGGWMIIRFSAFYEVLKSGEFPVRFLTRLNNGYGYPVADFLYPLFMYAGVPLHILGLSFVNTVKSLFIFSILFSSIFSFLWLRKKFDNLSSLVGSVFYVLFPYFVFDIYTRGSIGEALALSILPFILYQIERKSILLITIGTSLLLISHNTLSILFLPLIIAYSYLYKKEFVKKIFVCLLLSLGISSFFWIPAIFDLQYTVFLQTKVSSYSSYFINNNLLLLGFALPLLIIETTLYLFRKQNKNFNVLLIALLILLFLTLSYSDLLWKIIPLSKFIQFPFRIISLIIPIGAFLMSSLLNEEKNLKKYLLSIIYLLLIVFSASFFWFPKNIQIFPDSYYSTNMDTTTVKNEYMPKWVKNISTIYNSNKVELLGSSEKVNLLINKPNKLTFDINLNQPRTVQVNTVYFPGWVAYVNGTKKEILINNPNGLIRLSLNKGENRVIILFTETPIRLLSDFISIITLVSLLVYVGYNKFKKDKK